MPASALQRMQMECKRLFKERWPSEQKPLVFGSGKERNPALMLIGEAPGEQDTLQGRPFVGKAGKNLDVFLEALQWKRDDLYISNVVKIRPTKISSAGRTVNRPPSKGEIEFFVPWLMQEVAWVQPKALVTLGNVALHAFLPQAPTIGACHGRWQQVALSFREGTSAALPLFPLYHPASVIYRASLKEDYDRDLLILRNSLPGILNTTV